MDIKIPDKLKIGGFDYTIEQNTTFKQEGLAGEACHDELKIKLDVNSVGQFKDMSFIHELFHCIDCYYNNNSLKEEVIARLSNGLYQVLKDNNFIISNDIEIYPKPVYRKEIK